MGIRFIIGLVCLVSIGCSGGGSGGSDGDSDPITKSLYEEWIATDNSIRITLEEANGNINGDTFISAFQLSTGEICTCDTDMDGSFIEGTLTTSSCTYVSGGSGDPPCSYFDDDYTWSREGNVLTLCDSLDDCTDFE